jgi:hypothetical protein
MKRREALDKINRRAKRNVRYFDTARVWREGFDTVVGKKRFFEVCELVQMLKINNSSRCGSVAQLGEHLLCKLDRELLTFYRFLSFVFVYNNLGRLLFAQKLTPVIKTDRVLTQF